MRRMVISSVMAALCLAVALPAQGKGRKRGGAKVRGIQVTPSKVKPKTPAGHVGGNFAWKAKHPRLALELGKHAHLHAHLEANPGLFVRLRVQVDLDGNGVLSVDERGRFLVLLRASHAKRVPPGHTRGKAWWKKHHPALLLEFEKHPRLYDHLIANPGLYASLRLQIGLGASGKLSVRDRGRFMAQLRKHHDRKHAAGSRPVEKAKAESKGKNKIKSRSRSKRRGKGKKR